jgi:hypothetical protein
MQKTNGNDPILGFQDEGAGDVKGGLTKREYFAAMAMQGLLATMNHDNFAPSFDNVTYAANMSATAADLLIKSLNK